MAGRAGHTTETTTMQSTQSADGSARSTVTKTERLVQSSMGWAGLGGCASPLGALQNPSQCSSTTAPLPFTACPESGLTLLGAGLWFRAESLACPEPAWG